MMKICSLLTGLAFGLSMTIAAAQQPPGPPGAEGKRPPPRDCSKAPDEEKKARCEAHQKAVEKCKELKGEERHACMEAARPKKDK